MLKKIIILSTLLITILCACNSNSLVIDNNKHQLKIKLLNGANNVKTDTNLQIQTISPIESYNIQLAHNSFPVSINSSVENNCITVTPKASLFFDTKYILNINVTLTNGETINNEKIVFNTIKPHPPVITNLELLTQTAKDGNTTVNKPELILTFDQPVKNLYEADMITITDADNNQNYTFKIIDLDHNLSKDYKNNTYIIKLDKILDIDKIYNVKVDENVKNYDNQHLEQSKQFDFHTVKVEDEYLFVNSNQIPQFSAINESQISLKFSHSVQLSAKDVFFKNTDTDKNININIKQIGKSNDYTIELNKDDLDSGQKYRLELNNVINNKTNYPLDNPVLFFYGAGTFADLAFPTANSSVEPTLFDHINLTITGCSETNCINLKVKDILPSSYLLSCPVDGECNDNNKQTSQLQVQKVEKNDDSITVQLSFINNKIIKSNKKYSIWLDDNDIQDNKHHSVLFNSKYWTFYTK